jgi:hypothetical protein
MIQKNLDGGNLSKTDIVQSVGRIPETRECLTEKYPQSYLLTSAVNFSV